MKYEIKGGNLPVVVMNLEDGESVITQGGCSPTPVLPNVGSIKQNFEV